MNYAYIAGLVDGEGTIVIHHDKKYNNFCLLVRIRLTRIPVLRLFQEQYGGKLNFFRLNPSGKTMYDWAIGGRQAGLLLKKIYKYLVVKKEEAYVAIEFQTYMNRTRGKKRSLEKKEYLMNYRIRIRELNHRIDIL